MGLLDDRQRGLLAMQHNVDPRYKAAARAPAANAVRGLLNAFTPQNVAQLGLEMLPGAGDFAAARDSAQAGQEMVNSFKGGDYGGAASNALMSLGLGLGALPMIPALGGIVKRVDALRSGVPLDLPKAPEFSKAVASTPGAEITKDGLSLKLTRNQRPEQATEISVRGGVFYLPDGSKDAKFYSGKGHNYAYGGSETVKGESLFRKPLFVKGATGGKAPEAAFDAINGKGAYQAMRKDALHDMGMSFMPPDIRAESVTRFLDKYAPEMSPNAYEIIRNSAKGNQLPYALQEAAVASAVRRAGYDGVLGYSVKRKDKTPFISEVFDVREDYYPSADGDFSVWPEYSGE